MTPTHPPPDTIKSTARLAGLLYLVIIVAGVGGELVLRAPLMVDGDAAATVANLRAAPGWLRASIAADAAMAVADVGLAVLLYRLLRPAGPVLSLAAMVFRLVQAGILGANLLHLQAALQWLDPAGALGSFTDGQRAAMAMQQLALHAQGYDMGLVFFGVNGLITGLLLWRVAGPGRVLGPMVAAAGLVYLAGSGIRVLAPALSPAFAPAYALPLLAESAFCLWLLWGGGARLGVVARSRPW